ncbi:MAG: beta-N-acetylglucosaminidase domain-containing protein [Burkholderiales bacterium]|nr:beta-N-acetylglucosaminidase domain-containing protein [Burkholderiales bacterium]
MVVELGVIEGYFGRPWSHGDRRHVITRLRELGYAWFHYAPKADAFLRRRWREPHPPGAVAELAETAAHCRGLGMRFGVGLSPYELYRDFSGPARADFIAKVRALDELGIDELAILFDDTRGDVPALAAREAEIVHTARVHTRARRVLMCPTYYSDDRMLDIVFGERPAGYLEDLGRRLDPGVGVYWTGEEICAREQGVSHLARVADALGRTPTLWDNYPVNDGPCMSRHLHLRGFTGRPSLSRATCMRCRTAASMTWATSAGGCGCATRPGIIRWRPRSCAGSRVPTPWTAGSRRSERCAPAARRAGRAGRGLRGVPIRVAVVRARIAARRRRPPAPGANPGPAGLRCLRRTRAVSHGHVHGHVHVHVHVPGHRIRSVIGHLCVEPAVQGRCQSRVPGPVGQLRTSGDILVVDGDLARLRRLEVRQAGHLGAVDMHRTGEVALQEPGAHGAQMFAHEPQLPGVGAVPHDDLLDAAVRRLREDVQRGLQAEGHHVESAPGDFGLTPCPGRPGSGRRSGVRRVIRGRGLRVGCARKHQRQRRDPEERGQMHVAIPSFRGIRSRPPAARRRQVRPAAWRVPVIGAR